MYASNCASTLTSLPASRWLPPFGETGGWPFCIALDSLIGIDSSKPETGKEDASVEGNGDGNGQVPPGQTEDGDGNIVNNGSNMAPGLNRGEHIDKPANPNKPDKPENPGTEDKDNKKANKANKGTQSTSRRSPPNGEPAVGLLRAFSLNAIIKPLRRNPPSQRPARTTPLSRATATETVRFLRDRPKMVMETS